MSINMRSCRIGRSLFLETKDSPHFYFLLSYYKVDSGKSERTVLIRIRNLEIYRIKNIKWLKYTGKWTNRCSLFCFSKRFMFLTYLLSPIWQVQHVLIRVLDSPADRNAFLELIHPFGWDLEIFSPSFNLYGFSKPFSVFA